MRNLVAAMGVLFALSGCAAERACTLIGTPVGIAVRVDAPLAGRVSAAELTACWDGSCRTAKVELHPAGGVARQTCEGEACTAEVEPTGGKQGFVDVAGLPKARVRATLRLTGPTGEAVVERELTVTPKGAFPNGPDCGEGGPQASIAVSGSGEVSEVR
ncbi:hypothetical protein ACFSKW_21985 [Nonomuraea mangrovi]|uniref:Uncharacterized protein n=1 Tax=Nonomuraea mangrovi TaxID=2316207 RepID=A0ABW4SXE9_9ACTN